MQCNDRYRQVCKRTFRLMGHVFMYCFSSDLWVDSNVPGNDTGSSGEIKYDVGSAAGANDMLIWRIEFSHLTFLKDQSERQRWNLRVTQYLTKHIVRICLICMFINSDNCAVYSLQPSKMGPGLIGLGPSDSSVIFNTFRGSVAGTTVLDRIFLQDRSTPNFLTILLGRSKGKSVK